jgi:hypothetical protein
MKPPLLSLRFAAACAGVSSSACSHTCTAVEHTNEPSHRRDAWSRIGKCGDTRKTRMRLIRTPLSGCTKVAAVLLPPSADACRLGTCKTALRYTMREVGTERLTCFTCLPRCNPVTTRLHVSQAF